MEVATTVPNGRNFSLTVSQNRVICNQNRVSELVQWLVDRSVVKQNPPRECTTRKTRVSGRGNWQRSKVLIRVVTDVGILRVFS